MLRSALAATFCLFRVTPSLAIVTDVPTHQDPQTEAARATWRILGAESLRIAT
jgi:hypothetical protein